MSEYISALIAKVEKEYRDDVARALIEVGKPVERRLLNVATNEQLQALEDVAREAKERLTGGPGGLV
jgi:hypothetical protein